jgi:periplasmic protein CpxP/Spy
MKKKIALLAISLVAGMVSIMAQGQGGPRLTVEQRVAAANEKLVPLNLDKDKLAKTDSVFTSYYTAQQKERDEMMASGNMDRDAMREKMQKFSKERDDQLKQIFTEDQYKKWKDEIEPTLRPQRQNTQQ